MRFYCLDCIGATLNSLRGSEVGKSVAVVYSQSLVVTRSYHSQWADTEHYLCPREIDRGQWRSWTLKTWYWERDICSSRVVQSGSCGKPDILSCGRAAFPTTNKKATTEPPLLVSSLSEVFPCTSTRSERRKSDSVWSSARTARTTCCVVTAKTSETLGWRQSWPPSRPTFCSAKTLLTGCTSRATEVSRDPSRTIFSPARRPVSGKWSLLASAAV